MYITAKPRIAAQYLANCVIFIGYWLDMEIYVRVLVRSNIARRQERNINYAPEREHIGPCQNQ